MEELRSYIPLLIPFLIIEIGLLLIREGHQVQFPSDIEVFYIAPPSLDAIKRWVSERANTPKPN